MYHRSYLIGGSWLRWPLNISRSRLQVGRRFTHARRELHFWARQSIYYTKLITLVMSLLDTTSCYAYVSASTLPSHSELNLRCSTARDGRGAGPESFSAISEAMTNGFQTLPKAEQSSTALALMPAVTRAETLPRLHDTSKPSLSSFSYLFKMGRGADVILAVI